MSSIILGAFTGAAAGFTVGLMVAAMSRDGIWPNVWAGIILAGGSIGAAVGGLDLLF